MSAISLVNQVSPATTSSAEFHVFQDVNQVARVIVYPGDRASVPTSETLAAQAFTNSDEFELTSNEVLLDGGVSPVVRAQMAASEGFQDFLVTCEDGSPADTIVLQNRWTEPVTFRLTRPASSYQMIATVDPNGEHTVSTAQQWSVYAIVNGITTQTVSVTDPNATVVLNILNKEEGFVLQAWSS